MVNVIDAYITPLKDLLKIRLSVVVESKITGLYFYPLSDYPYTKIDVSDLVNYEGSVVSEKTEVNVHPKIHLDIDSFEDTLYIIEAISDEKEDNDALFVVGDLTSINRLLLCHAYSNVITSDCEGVVRNDCFECNDCGDNIGTLLQTYKEALYLSLAYKDYYKAKDIYNYMTDKSSHHREKDMPLTVSVGFFTKFNFLYQ